MTLSARASTMRAFETAIDVGSRNPVRGSFTGCCASRALLVRKSAADKQTKTWGDSGLHLSPLRAITKHATTITSFKSATLFSEPGKCNEQQVWNSEICSSSRLYARWLLARASCLYSPNHSICFRQYFVRDGEADLLGRFEIDDQLEFGGLLDGQIRWLHAFQNSIDIACRTAE